MLRVTASFAYYSDFIPFFLEMAPASLFTVKMRRKSEYIHTFDFEINIRKIIELWVFTDNQFFNFDYLFFEIIAEKFQVEKIIIEILGKTF